VSLSEADAVDGFRPNWSRWLPPMIVLILIVSVGLGGWLIGYRMNIQTATVAPPAAVAAPDDVVLAYVSAYNHRDFDTMATLYPTRPRRTWIERHRAIGTMRDFKIITSKQDTSHGPHSPYWAIEVKFRYTGLTGADIAYEPGPTGWTYYLQRRGPGDPWRIVDHGAG
jgi:hypothetical protein